MKLKLGDKVWLFVGNHSVDGNKRLAIGQYIATNNGKRAIRVGNRMVRRKLCEIAKVTGKEKFDFS